MAISVRKTLDLFVIARGERDKTIYVQSRNRIFLSFSMEGGRKYLFSLIIRPLVSLSAVTLNIFVTDTSFLTG